MSNHPLARMLGAINAIKNGDTVTLEKLLKEGLNPNATDKNGYTLVFIAVMQHKVNIDAIKLLVKYGANCSIKVNGSTPISHAIQNNNLNVIFQILLLLKDLKLQLSIGDQKLIRNFIRDNKGISNPDRKYLKQLFVDYKIKNEKLHDKIISLLEKLGYISERNISNEDDPDESDELPSFDEIMFYDELEESNSSEPSESHSDNEDSKNNSDDENEPTKIPTGNCQGITIGWIESELVEEEKLSNQHLRNALKIYDQSSDEVFTLLNSISHKKGLNLTDGEQTLLNVYPFFDRIKLYQNPKSFIGKLFPHGISQSSLEMISNIASSQSMQSAGGLCVANYMLNILSLSQLRHLINHLEKIFVNLPYDPKFKRIACAVACHNHLVAISYDQQRQRWKSIFDINEGLPIPLTTAQELVDYHFKYYFDLENDKDDLFEVLIIVPKNHPALAFLKTELQRFNIQALNLLAKKFQHNDNDSNLIDLMILAAQNGLTEVFEVFANYKINLNQTNNEDWTPLSIAAEFGHARIVEILAMNGANLNEADHDGDTPALFASRAFPEVIKVLAKYNADLNQSDSFRNTPAIVAAKYGCLPVLKELAERGADVTLANKNGDTPISIAKQQGHLDVVEYLTKLHIERNNQITYRSRGI